MNLARAPWNNPTLNGLIEVTELLVTGNLQYAWFMETEESAKPRE